METKQEQKNERKYFLSEFSFCDGEYEVTFNIIDVDLICQSITVAISRAGKILQDTFTLLRDCNDLYFEYGNFYESKIALNSFTEVD